MGNIRPADPLETDTMYQPENLKLLGYRANVALWRYSAQGAVVDPTHFFASAMPLLRSGDHLIVRDGRSSSSVWVLTSNDDFARLPDSRLITTLFDLE